VSGPDRPTPLADALESWIDRSGLRKRLDLASVVDAWPEAMGPQIAAVTRALGVTPDGTLLVRVATPGWATELGLMTPRILTRVNGSHKGRVLQIRWMVGPLDRP
jgi:predicted nucleic acid-binding Zn ribbon protein